jgi:hypothetical protein
MLFLLPHSLVLLQNKQSLWKILGVHANSHPQEPELQLHGRVTNRSWTKRFHDAVERVDCVYGVREEGGALTFSSH